MTKKIIFSAGGTGGHIFPAVNLMNHFLEKGNQVLLVTDKRGNNFIKNYSGFKSCVLKTETLTNKNFFKKLVSALVIFYSIIKSIIILKKEKPDLILGFGGYVSFPVAFASKFFKLPLVIYENNLVLGRANKYLLPLSKKILIATTIAKNFPEKYRSKICQVGSILNKNIINCHDNKKKNSSKNFTILVLGGSQGAEIFGKIIPYVIKKIKSEGYTIEIVQQCISSQKESIINIYKNSNIKNHVFEFDKNILDLILSSNLAITRCGSSTMAELAHTFTPFVAVPLPNSIDNHQYLNAKYYENKGYCWILGKDNFNSENLLNLIIEILKNKNKLEKIKMNMKKDYNANVYSNIENALKDFI